MGLSNTKDNLKWFPNSITVAGGNGKGNAFNQLCCPWGLCIDDFLNNRIVEWKYGVLNGQIIS